MIIPATYGQASYLFQGPCTPNGAAVTIGFHNLTALDPVEVGDVFAEVFNANLASIFSNQLDGAGVLVKFGPTATGPSGTSGTAFGGTATGVAGPPSVALLTHKVTALGGRAGRGRNYWPGFFEQEVNEAGVVSPTAMAGLQEAYDDFLAQLLTNEIVPVVLHGAGSPIEDPTPITSFTVDARVATQRRRLRR